MPLATDAVDRHALGEQLVHLVVEELDLVFRAAVAECLDVVVVVEQESIPVGCSRPPEGVGDVTGAVVLVPEPLVVDLVRGIPRVGQPLVHDIPLPDLTLEVRHHVGDVLLEKCAQLVLADGPSIDAVGEPLRQLVLPYQDMTAHALVVLAREVDELVGRSPVVGPPRRLEQCPLHDVLGGDRRELRSDERTVAGIRGVIQRLHIDRRPDVQAVTCAERAQALLRWLRGGRVGDRRRNDAQDADRCHSGSAGNSEPSQPHRDLSSSWTPGVSSTCEVLFSLTGSDSRGTVRGPFRCRDSTSSLPVRHSRVRGWVRGPSQAGEALEHPVGRQAADRVGRDRGGRPRPGDREPAGAAPAATTSRFSPGAAVAGNYAPLH